MSSVGGAPGGRTVEPLRNDAAGHAAVAGGACELQVLVQRRQHAQRAQHAQHARHESSQGPGRLAAALPRKGAMLQNALSSHAPLQAGDVELPHQTQT